MYKKSYIWGGIKYSIMHIAGRQKEIGVLQSLLDKKDSSFLAVYGRRRIGKTYLVRQVYRSNIVFECAGLHQKEKSQQLENFWLALNEANPNAETSGIKSSGDLTTVLEELTQCDFIKPIYPIDKSKEGCLYRLTDEYSLFYFKFLAHGETNSSWARMTQKPAYKIWSGYAFENLCFKHEDLL